MDGTTTTRSLPAAAYAVASGQQLPRIKQTEAGSQYFEFVFDGDSSEESSRLINAYFRGDSVSAREFYCALQDVRFALNRAKIGGAQ